MIDLHSHTDRSDGTFTPSELVAEGERIGLTALAITDHDTFAGYDAAPKSDKLEIVCGIELSTKFNGSTIHMLAYFPSAPPSAEFRAWLNELQESRRDRNRRLADKLRSLGVEITLEEVEQKGRSLTGRPHFARVLVEKGYATDLQHAFNEYLDESAKGFVYRDEVAIEDAILRVNASGGIPTMAHPVRVAKNDWSKLALYVGQLAGLGLQGIEVYHSDHSPENVAYYKSLAERNNLKITGGSDFHGGNKPNIQLGTGIRNNLHVADAVLANLR